VAADIASKFTSDIATVEAAASTAGGGLVSLEEARAQQQYGYKEPTRETRPSASDCGRSVMQKRILSFNAYEDEEDEEAVVLPPSKKKPGRLGMDPTVDTSFLPDHEREVQIARRKEELAEEWRQLQEKGCYMCTLHSLHLSI